MTEGRVVGVRPWLPGALGQWDWLTGPIRAERLAALRIGVGLVLLFDILVTYLPNLSDYYGPGSLAAPDVFADRFASPYWFWSVLRWLPDAWGPQAALAAWALAALALTVGWRPQVAAAVAWALSVSFFNSNYYLHNGGDRLRHALLLILALCPSGAVWRLALTPVPSPAKPGEGGTVNQTPTGLTGEGSSSSPLSRLCGRGDGGEGPVYVSAWPVRLLLLQLVLVYFLNGVYKLLGSDWRDGCVMHYVMCDAGWSRFTLLLPPAVNSALAWFVLAWELGFPLLAVHPTTRAAALAVGAAFHIGTGLQLEIVVFPLYALCFYLPLLPWERWTACNRAARPPQ